MKKKPIKMLVSSFFYNIGPNLAQILPQIPHPLSFFFVDFQWNMLGDSVNINSLCCNPVVLKNKIGKTSKNCFFGPNFHKKGVIMNHAQNEKRLFLAEITNPNHQLSETFNFLKISYIFLLSYESFSILSDSFCGKCHSQLKQLWMSLLLTLNIFHTFFKCFYCWLWTSKC